MFETDAVKEFATLHRTHAQAPVRDAAARPEDDGEGAAPAGGGERVHRSVPVGAEFDDAFE
eukprot:3517278-Pyramimonas_sp.AAC.1